MVLSLSLYISLSLLLVLYIYIYTYVYVSVVDVDVCCVYIMCLQIYIYIYVHSICLFGGMCKHSHMHINGTHVELGLEGQVYAAVMHRGKKASIPTRMS